MTTKKLLGFTRIERIVIGENCFIGDSAIILPNVSVGSSSIIGAGSIVTSDISEKTVAAGNPARILGKLDEYMEKISQ